MVMLIQGSYSVMVVVLSYNRAKKHKNIHWHKKIFTDESSIWLNQGKIQIWTRGERPILNIPCHAPKVHIYGGISARGATSVKIFRHNFNSEHYCNV